MNITAHHRAINYYIITNRLLYCTDVVQQHSHYSKKAKMLHCITTKLLLSVSKALLTNNASAL